MIKLYKDVDVLSIKMSEVVFLLNESDTYKQVGFSTQDLRCLLPEILQK